MRVTRRPVPPWSAMQLGWLPRPRRSRPLQLLLTLGPRRLPQPPLLVPPWDRLLRMQPRPRLSLGLLRPPQPLLLVPTRDQPLRMQLRPRAIPS